MSRRQLDDRSAGALFVLVLALLMMGLWAASDGPTTCVERAPAGIMCTTDHPTERRP